MYYFCHRLFLSSSRHFNSDFPPQYYKGLKKYFLRRFFLQQSDPPVAISPPKFLSKLSFFGVQAQKVRNCSISELNPDF